MSGPRRCPRAIPICTAAGTPQILLLVFRPPKPREASCFWQSRDTSACRAAGGDSTVHSTALPGLQRRCGSRGHPSTTTARACHDAGGRVSSSSHTRHMRRQSGHFLATHIATGVNVKSLRSECASTKLPGQGPISEQTCQSDQVCIGMLSYNESISHVFYHNIAS